MGDLDYLYVHIGKLLLCVSSVTNFGGVTEQKMKERCTSTQGEAS